MLLFVLLFGVLAGVVGISLYFALKKPKSSMLQKPRKTFWLILEMISFAFSIIFALILPWMRLSSPSSLLDSLAAYSGNQHLSLIDVLDVCTEMNLPFAVPFIVYSLICVSIYVFISYIVMCFARREQRQPKGIVLSIMIGISALLFEAYRLFLNTGMDSGGLGGIYSFTTTGTWLLVLVFDVAAVIFGYMNAKKRNEPISATTKKISKKYCVSCGMPLAKSASFCEHCGAAVNRGDLIKDVEE